MLRRKRKEVAERRGRTLETEWGNLLIVECAGCQFGEFGAQMFADCKGYVATTLATISQAGTHTHTHTLR